MHGVGFYALSPKIEIVQKTETYFLFGQVVVLYKRQYLFWKGVSVALCFGTFGEDFGVACYIPPPCRYLSSCLLLRPCFFSVILFFSANESGSSVRSRFIPNDFISSPWVSYMSSVIPLTPLKSAAQKF